MSDYVSRVLLEINGVSVEDFNSVEEQDFELAKPVNLMNKTGHIAMLPRYGVSVDYIIPSDSTPFDFTAVIGGVLTIDHQNNRRVIYVGVRTTKIGKVTYDGEKEATQTIEFSAEDRLVL
jgi:hypothetical protein